MTPSFQIDFGLTWLGLVWFSFQDSVSVRTPSHPGAHSVDQAVLELSDLSASAS